MKRRSLDVIKQQRPIVGLLGLGIIGQRVAAKLRREGVSLFVWNRTPRAEPNFLASPLEVAESADLLQIFVRDGAALLEVLQQLSPALTARHLILNHATVSPHHLAEAAALVEKRGAQFLDAPFTGSREAAKVGKLVYYLGGTSQAITRAMPVLELSSEHIIPMGSVGSATCVKIATNLIMGVQVQALAEAMAMLHVAEVPLQRLAEALQYSAARSGVIGMKFPLMVEGEFEPHFSTKNMFKDLALALDVVKPHGIPLPTAAATANALHQLMLSGRGDADYSVSATQYDYPGREENVAFATFKPERSSPQQHAVVKKKTVFSFFKNLFEQLTRMT